MINLVSWDRLISITRHYSTLSSSHVCSDHVHSLVSCQYMMATSWIFFQLYSLYSLSTSLIMICYSLTVPISLVVHRNSEGRSWARGMLSCKAEVSTSSLSKGVHSPLIGSSGPFLSTTGLRRIWRFRIFESISLDICASFLNVPLSPCTLNLVPITC